VGNAEGVELDPPLSFASVLRDGEEVFIVSPCLGEVVLPSSEVGVDDDEGIALVLATRARDVLIGLWLAAIAAIRRWLR
jgi:hypothetical protein